MHSTGFPTTMSTWNQHFANTAERLHMNQECVYDTGSLSTLKQLSVCAAFAANAAGVSLQCMSHLKRRFIQAWEDLPGIHWEQEGSG